MTEQEWLAMDCCNLHKWIDDCWFDKAMGGGRRARYKHDECRRTMRLWAAALVSEGPGVPPRVYDKVLEVADGLKLRNEDIDRLLDISPTRNQPLVDPERILWNLVIPRSYHQETPVLELVFHHLPVYLPLKLLRDMVRWPMPLEEIRLPSRMLTRDVVALTREACKMDESNRLSPLNLSVLADALEDAGCEQENLLFSLRGYEPYNPSGWREIPFYHGTWSLDVVLKSIKEES